MKYWDASAIAAILLNEPAAARVRATLAEDPVILTWAWTAVEVAGAVERRHREGKLSRAQRRGLLSRLSLLESAWQSIHDLPAVAAGARALLARHPLRAADAGQLAAAMLAIEGHPASMAFVCLDERLAEAAEREGLSVVGPE